MSFLTAWFRLRPSLPAGVETIDCSRCLVDKREFADVDVSAPGTGAPVAQLDVQQAAAHVAVDIGEPGQRAGIAAGQLQDIVRADFASACATTAWPLSVTAERSTASICSPLAT